MSHIGSRDEKNRLICKGPRPNNLSFWIRVGSLTYMLGLAGIGPSDHVCHGFSNGPVGVRQKSQGLASLSWVSDLHIRLGWYWTKCWC